MTFVKNTKQLLKSMFAPTPKPSYTIQDLTSAVLTSNLFVEQVGKTLLAIRRASEFDNIDVISKLDESLDGMLSVNKRLNELYEKMMVRINEEKTQIND